MELTQEDLKILLEVDSLLTPSNVVNAVYIPPAQAMRNIADRIDREDKLKSDFKNLLRRLQWLPEVSTTTVYGNLDTGWFATTDGNGANLSP